MVTLSDLACVSLRARLIAFERTSEGRAGRERQTGLPELHVHGELLTTPECSSRLRGALIAQNVRAVLVSYLGASDIFLRHTNLPRTVFPVRIGIGGGAFGVRGGISNRGIGVGVGPLSVGTSWGSRRKSRSRGRGSGDGGALAFAVIAGALFLVVAWPYLLGTYVAVGLGADNPSTARSVVGWTCEILWIAGLLVGFIVWSTKSAKHSREQAELAAAQAQEQARQHAGLVASGVVYPTRQGNSTVYRHGACTINHRSSATAERCRLKG